MSDRELQYQNQITELEQQIRLLKEQVDFLTRKLCRAVDKPPNFVNVTRYHDKNLAKIAEIFQRKRSWFPMPWPLSSF